MSPIDVTLIQNALKQVERAMDAMKSDADPIQLLRIKLDLIDAKSYLRIALVGHVEQEQDAA